MTIRTTAIAVAAAGAAAAVQAQALDTRAIASGLSLPVYATAPLAGGPTYIVEKGGAIKTALNGVVTGTVLTIPVATQGERGLLGLAFDPNFGNAGTSGYQRFFVDYIDPGNFNTVIASYTLAANPTATAATRTEVLRFAQQADTNHKGGWIGFKPGNVDNLYIATGDGGSSNDPNNNAQNPNVLLGKMLRIDVNGSGAGTNYAIPTGNPYAGSGGRAEIFSLGLRNPFRDSFDRLNGNLWIADVGQGAREEIDFIAGTVGTGGQNFGWRLREGNIQTPAVGGAVPPGYVPPILDYDHTQGASIIGGYVVREAGSPLFGKYVFGDYVSGRIWAIAGDGSVQTLAQAQELTAALDAGGAGALQSIVSFGEAANGALYIVDIGTGTNGRVVQVTAVPEPATWALWLAGVAGIGAAARRRRAT